MSWSADEWYIVLKRAFAQRAGVRLDAAPRREAKAQRAATLAALDRANIGARARSQGTIPAQQRQGGPYLVQAVREQEVARLNSFWNRW